MVETGLRTIRDDSIRWPVLPARTKAKFLRFEASWVLQQHDDLVQACRLADEAKVLDPSQNEALLRALIAYRKAGAETALTLLDGQKDIDSLNFKAGLLLELGRIPEARAVLLRLQDGSHGGN